MMTTPNWNEYVGTSEAGRELNLSCSRILELIQEGKLEAIQLAPRSPWRISKASIQQLLSKLHTNEARP